MTDEHHCGYVALWREKTFMRTGAFLMNSSSNRFESYVILLLLQNGKKSLQRDLSVLGSLLSAGMI